MLSPRIRPRALALALTALAAASCSDLATEPPPVAVDPTAVAKATVAHVVEAAAAGCSEGVMPSGARIQICSPAFWNGSVMFYAHGYVDSGEPLAVPQDAVSGVAVADIVRALGFLYASTSYRRNGLVAADGAKDLEELAALVQGAHPSLATAPAYLAGVSEGGLATALAMQNPSTRFDGALEMCGPVGIFPLQINYLGDFRLVFDYFFPGVLPGGPFDPAALSLLQPNWDGTWAPAIRAAIAADLGAGGARTQQLFAVTRASRNPADAAQTVVDLLWYNAFATPDAIQKLGGLPFSNTTRSYSGSQNDALLNASIPRFASTANPTELARYSTSGRLERPTVALHTVGDQIVPFWNLMFYVNKVVAQGDKANLQPTPVSRYGHCNFTVAEVLAATVALVNRVGSQQLTVSAEIFPTPAEEEDFLRLARAHGARPTIVRGEIDSRR